ncbi:hypothetical protein CP97_14622 [Aurantiacibacter atlanticus]|uniref:Uncharacterized protein n=1 Tax=Aurantiacibacter atlanticus TaxID=1648404 RepID=A0A168LZN6_9SPHN|nr:hypothetical protein CP97_14622 [Aurantiacibacter atlanticus]
MTPDLHQPVPFLANGSAAIAIATAGILNGDFVSFVLHHELFTPWLSMTKLNELAASTHAYPFSRTI